jgi:hypothetical protein
MVLAGRQMDEWMEGETERDPSIQRTVDRQTDRQTDRPRQTDGRTDECPLATETAWNRKRVTVQLEGGGRDGGSKSDGVGAGQKWAQSSCLMMMMMMMMMMLTYYFKDRNLSLGFRIILTRYKVIILKNETKHNGLPVNSASQFAGIRLE